MRNTRFLGAEHPVGGCMACSGLGGCSTITTYVKSNFFKLRIIYFFGSSFASSLTSPTPSCDCKAFVIAKLPFFDPCKIKGT